MGGLEMDVRNCKVCGRLFNYIGGAPYCQSCRNVLEEKFQEVKTYLDRRPHATIGQVSEELDISAKQIKEWIREERLSLTTAGADGIVCEQCGTPICTGKYCDKCKASMANTLAGALAKPKVPEESQREYDGNRMRFL